jgi:uncharacterized RDD family membrane protein YckC
MSELVSGEAVLLELRVARLATRGLAFALDVLIQLAALLFIFLILSAGDLVGFDEALTSAITILILIAVLVGYPVVTETLSRGRTVGKIALGLRVVRADGGPIRFRQALVRALAGVIVDFWALGLFGVVAVIVSMSSKNAQRIGDLLAGTLVIRERIPQQREAYIAMPPPLASWAAELHVSSLPDDLALAVRQYLSRIRDLSPNAAASLGHQLTAEVATHIGTPIPPGVPIEAYLTAVLAERRTREQSRLYQQPPPPPPPPPTAQPHPTDNPFAPPG